MQLSFRETIWKAQSAIASEMVQKWINRIIIALGVIVLISLVWSGFSNQKRVNDDKNKIKDISFVVGLLDQFYQDSSAFIEERHYPVARCSAELNTFDYEYTFRRNILGISPSENTHAYLQVSNFPYDSLGSYTSQIDSAGNNQCRKGLPLLESGAKTFSDQSKMCQFDSAKKPNCYLYTTSTNGDSYKISYYSTSKNAFVIYTRFRDQPVQGPRYFVPN